MEKYKKGGREIALEILYQIESKGAYSNLELNSILEKYNPPKEERNLTTELVYGVLRRRNTLDWIIEQFSKRPVEKMTGWIRNILRLSVYQLVFLDRIPISAACNEGVNLAKKRGHLGVSKFVNAILRNVARNLADLPWPSPNNLAQYISIKYSHPLWMVEKWLARLGKDGTIALCEANNQSPPLTIRTNSLKITREQLAADLEKKGIKNQVSSLVSEGIKLLGVSSLGKMDAYQKGLFQVQDESSMLAAHLLDPQPGENILDACSAPGGKTTHLAEKMKNHGKIIANELYEHKIPLIEESCQRLGIDIVETRVGDARDLASLYSKQMDRVLVDAPCSGLGVLRRKPDARWKKKPEDIEELNKVQLEILESAAQCLKPGGILVYSTCSIEPEENQGILQSFLARNPDFQLSSIREYLPEVLTKRELDNPSYLQLHPQDYNTDGFFLSRLERKRT